LSAATCWQVQVRYVFATSVHGAYVTANQRAPAIVELAVTAQSTIYSDGSYVVPATIDIDGLSLTPSKTILVKEAQRKYEL
jgi:hypothetical protein